MSFLVETVTVAIDLIILRGLRKTVIPQESVPNCGRTVFMTTVCVALLAVMFSSRGCNARSVRNLDDLPTEDETAYLMQFGYMAMSDIETGQQRSIEEVWNAVRDLQRMAGLPVTGTFDQATRELMGKPRCGMPDSRQSTETHDQDQQPLSYKLNSGKWPKTDVSYRIVNKPDDMDEGSTRRAIWEAFSLWKAKSMLTFTERLPSDTADIDISFVSGYHGDGYQFDGRGNVLAHAFPPGSGRGGDIHFDSDERWASTTEQGTNLFSVAAHELGHALGVGHTTVRGSLMYPWYDQYNPTLTLGPDDIDAIQYLYGSQTPSRPTSRPARTRRPAATTTQSPDRGQVCNVKYDAITTMRGNVFAFRGKQAWRMNEAGEPRDDRPIRLSEIWSRLPRQINAVDAILEQPGSRIVVVFRGARFWEFDGNRLAANVPPSGRPLTDIGLPSTVTHIDAALVGLEGSRRPYLFSGYEYWRLKEGLMELDRGYPRDIGSVWRGVQAPIDAAFTDFSGKTYFFKDDSYWLFNGTKLEVAAGYPRRIAEKWTMLCSENMQVNPNGGGSSSQRLGQLSRVFVLVVPMLSFLVNGNAV